MKRICIIVVLVAMGFIPAGLSPAFDFNGDGADDVAIFRPSTGLWAVRGVTRSYFGTWNDEPAVGDYDGDGTDEIAIYRATTGLWAIQGGPRIYYGTAGDLPIGSSDGDWYRSGQNLCVLAAGNIGIGTGTPEFKMHMVGSNPRLLIEATSAPSEINFRVAGSGTDWAIYMDDTTNDLQFYQGGAKVTIQATTGNVGIGIQPPMRKLHVNGLMRLEPLGSDPAPASAGDLYFNGNTKKLRCYDGTTWQDCF